MRTSVNATVVGTTSLSQLSTAVNTTAASTEAHSYVTSAGRASTNSGAVVSSTVMV